MAEAAGTRGCAVKVSGSKILEMILGLERIVEQVEQLTLRSLRNVTQQPLTITYRVRGSRSYSVMYGARAPERPTCPRFTMNRPGG